MSSRGVRLAPPVATERDVPTPGGADTPDSETKPLRVGPYELGERIGRGGMADVWTGSRPGANGIVEMVAIKRIRPELANRRSIVQMFCDEARVCALLAHPNIPRILDFGRSDGVLFMAMEHVDGWSCRRVLQAAAASGRRFSPAAALWVAHELLQALEFAHDAVDETGVPLRIVHRDVSPGNVLLSRRGSVKLGDFGIVRSEIVARRTLPGVLKGKLGYMSPEQVAGAEIDRRSDLFSAGVVLAEMLLGEPLFTGETELELLEQMYRADVRLNEGRARELPRQLRALVERALRHDLSARFQTASELSSALRAAADDVGCGMSEAALVATLTELGLLSGSSGTFEVSRSAPARPRLEVLRDIADVREAFERSEARDPGRNIRERGFPSPHPGGLQYRLEEGEQTPPRMLSLSDLAERIATGRIDRNAALVVGDVPIGPVGSLPPLARLAERPAYQFDERLHSRATWRLPVDRATLPAVLFALISSGKTGLLQLSSGDHQKRVYFVQGVPSAISSTSRDELLGARIVELALGASDDVRQAVDHACRHGQRIGEALVSVGAVGAASVVRALVAQLEGRFLEIGQWRSGDMVFVAGEKSGLDVPPPIHSAFELVAMCVRRGYSDGEVGALLEPFGANPIALRKAHGFPLQEPTATITAHARGGTLDELTDEKALSHLARAELLREVFIALSCGALTTPGWPHAATSAIIGPRQVPTRRMTRPLDPMSEKRQ